MFRTRYDIPFDADLSTRFLPWVIALTSFVTTTLLFLCLTLSSLIGDWNLRLNGKMTIQIPEKALQKNPGTLSKILDFLKEHREIRKVHVLTEGEVKTLLSPWVGPQFDWTFLTVPRVAEVEFNAHERPDIASLRLGLERIVPGTTADSHDLWYRNLLHIGILLKAVFYCIIVFVSLASIGTFIFTSFSSLAVHRQIIDVLRLVGARNTYVAAQFQYQTLRMALRGSLYSLIALASLSACVFSLLSGVEYHHFLPPIFDIILVLIAVPLFVILTTTLTTRITVGYVLNKDI